MHPQEEDQQHNCCWTGSCAAKGLTINLQGKGGWVLTGLGLGGVSPVPAVGHEEKNFANAAEAIFQRGKRQKRQLGSAL